MAAEGIDFRNFSVANPVCSTSRTAIMTGQFPVRHSIHGHFASVASHVLRNMPNWLNPHAPKLQRMLKEAGYATAHFGKWHLTNIHVKDGPAPLPFGYDDHVFLQAESPSKNERAATFNAVKISTSHPTTR